MKRQRLCVLCFSALLAAGGAHNVFAQTHFYVNASWAGTTPGTDPDGSGPATSFGTDAFATLPAAIAAAGTDDTVSIATGTYTLTGTLNLATAGLIVTGVAKDSVVVDATRITGYGIAISANRATIEGFTLLGPAGGSGSTDYGIKASRSVKSLSQVLRGRRLTSTR